MEEARLKNIDAALAEIRLMTAQAFESAAYIERLLTRRRNFGLGSAQKDRPGPFLMGLIAVREFDTYEDRPERAALIKDVQGFMQEKMGRRGKAECGQLQALRSSLPSFTNRSVSLNPLHD